VSPRQQVTDLTKRLVAYVERTAAIHVTADQVKDLRALLEKGRTRELDHHPFEEVDFHEATDHLLDSVPTGRFPFGALLRKAWNFRGVRLEKTAWTGPTMTRGPIEKKANDRYSDLSQCYILSVVMLGCKNEAALKAFGEASLKENIEAGLITREQAQALYRAHMHSLRSGDRASVRLAHASHELRQLTEVSIDRTESRRQA
jgi:hypothetical protein